MEFSYHLKTNSIYSFIILHNYKFNIKDSAANSTPTLITSYAFPSSVVSDKSILMHMVLDFQGQKLKEGISPNDSRNVYAYISDIVLGNIIVFDWKNEASFKKTSQQMKSKAYNFEILGDAWLRSGVRGMSLESSEKVRVYISILLNSDQFSS